MALVAIEAPDSPTNILQKYQKKAFWVADSKKIFSGTKGLRTLELNVLSFYYLYSRVIPRNLREFLPSLNETWYNEELRLPLTVTKEEIITHSSKIEKILKIHSIKIINIKRCAISAREFNNLVDILHNKSLVTQEILKPLISMALGNEKYTNLTIDKQGGKKFYKDFLNKLVPVSIIREDEDSLYHFENGQILFAPRSDSFDFSVALASMFSKYSREVAMTSFNNYWTKLYPEIKPTAGYYVDGTRFINDLKSHGISIPDQFYIRKK